MAIMPCADDIPGADHNDAHGLFSYSNADSHSHESPDDCTPFCICQCCGASITAAQLAETDGMKKPNTFSYSLHYSFNYDYHYSNGIWHPPTVC
jgi:hypothetical protein